MSEMMEKVGLFSESIKESPKSNQHLIEFRGYVDGYEAAVFKIKDESKQKRNSKYKIAREKGFQAGQKTLTAFKKNLYKPKNKPNDFEGF